ncbi:MAG: recombinase family protein [Patescibacteria group bacterium]|nr:recombinase family protein [Patescibacteria group bacterium]
MPKVLGYIRQSKDRDDQPNSEAAQFDAIMRYHTARQIQFPDKWPKEIVWARDIDVSGRLVPFLERQGGREIQRISQPGDCLVVSKLDRFGRDTIDNLTAIRWFEARNVSLHFLDVQIDSTTVMGRAMLGVVSILAQVEAERTAERTCDALASLKRRGERYNFRPGHGNKFVERDGKTFIEPDLELRVAIDKAMEMHAAGYPYHLIAAHFELHGPKPPPHFAPHWTGKNIGNLLRKERKLRAMKQVA